MKTQAIFVCAMAGGFAGLSQADAATINAGLYDLHNHSITTSTSPEHGLKINKLYSPAGSKRFVFDFDHPDSNMQLRYNANRGVIRIFGSAFGGRDYGWYIADDQYAGMYDFDFTYNVGVDLLRGDDDMIVAGPAMANGGTITTPLGDVFSMFDTPDSDGVSFNLGDGVDNLGHRGETGISGWGGFVHDDGTSRFLYSPAYFGDWIFTATPVPTPGSLALAAVGGGCLIRRRRH